MSGQRTSTEGPDFGLVWDSVLDGRYEARVVHTDSPSMGRLMLTDTLTGEVLIDEAVMLMSGAVFGPDVSDVNT